MGIPTGYGTYASGVSFEPKLLSLSTNNVSLAGSTIQATIKGVGENDEVTLVDSTTKTDLCLTKTVKSYGLLECVLNPSFDFSAGPVDLQVKDKAGNYHICANADSTKCKLTKLGT